MTIDYDKLHQELQEMNEGVHVTTRYTWADLATELLTLREGVINLKEGLEGLYFAGRVTGRLEKPSVSNIDTIRQLNHLLAGGTARHKGPTMNNELNDLTNLIPENAVITGMVAAIEYIDPETADPQVITHVKEGTGMVTASGLANFLTYQTADMFADEDEEEEDDY